MIRIFVFLLVSASVFVRASEPISVAYEGASVTVRQPHVTAELIPETTAVQPGESFDVALHLHSDPSWHTYWINPGDAGLATTIKWTLPPGFTAGPIQWPTPEKHKMGPLVTYGYEGDVYLLTTITPSKSDLPKHFDIKANARWLVCQEECIPGKGDFTLSMDSGSLNLKLPVDNKDFFDAARGRLPVANTAWDVKAAYGKGGGTVNAQKKALWISFATKASSSIQPVGTLYFFPEQSNVLNADESDNGMPDPDKSLSGFELSLTLQQNGEKPTQMSGILVSDRALIGGSKAVYIPVFSTDAKDLPMMIVRTGESLSASGLNRFAYPQVMAKPSVGAASSLVVADNGHRPPLQGEAASPLGTAAATSETAPSLGTAAATSEAAPSLGTGPVQPFLLAVFGAAFIGGLILNLMPCVLPVLSLKVFSLMKHAGEDPRGAWKQGAAFTAGVVISFWLLAGLLLTLRAAGNQLGWGFQMQSPGFVLALIFIFFLLALNLFGVFELGASLVGLDAKVTGRAHGLTSSFLNGALATLAATPCTAPFMGSALGFAAQQPAIISLLIFTFLAMGMATPYLLLTIFPGALKFVPKPGAWMETFKQFMGFLLMATVIFLLYVFGALVGEEAIFVLLFGLLVGAMGAWLYGNRQRSSVAGWPSAVLVLILMLLGLGIGAEAAMGPLRSDKSEGKEADGYQPWSQDAVQKALADGKPVFVDFTAAWCLSCKVNERVALDTDAVRKAFADKNVVLLKADWTQADPEISKALQQFNRDGVPLYLLYSPKQPMAPQVLPEVLTPGIVLEALGKFREVFDRINKINRIGTKAGSRTKLLNFPN